MAATSALVTSQITNSILQYNLTTGAYTGVFAKGLLVQPQGIAIGPSDGRVYVSDNDPNNLSVLRYKTDGSGQVVFAQNGAMQNPIGGICFDSTGKLYVANPQANNVLLFNADGSFNSVFASGNTLSFPNNCRIGSDGKLYVVTGGVNSGVLRFNSNGTFDQAFIGGNAPTDLVQDSNGNWYVSDGTSKSVLMYNSAGSLQGLFATAGGGNPSLGGLAIAPDGSLLVARADGSAGTRFFGSSVLKFNGSTGAFVSVFLSGGFLNAPYAIAFI